MRNAAMLTMHLLDQQKTQFRHDKRNHTDILCLSKIDRLKHYGLHYCKYVGRLVRGNQEEKTPQQTIVDAFLVCLSAANALHQDFSMFAIDSGAVDLRNDSLFRFADAAGRFADGCEKFDHAEEFSTQMHVANLDIMRSILSFPDAFEHAKLFNLVSERRRQLGKRHFYIDESSERLN